MGYNRFEQVPQLDAQPHLKELHLQSNALSELTGLDRLKGLAVLSLHRNKLVELGTGLKGLKNLGKLHAYRTARFQSAQRRFPERKRVGD